MSYKVVLLGFFVMVILAVTTTSSFADLLSGEYTINVTTTQIAVDSWQFVYDITNVNQSIGGTTGFDGFYIQVPLTATISNVSVPAPYSVGWGDTRWNWGLATVLTNMPVAPEAPLLSGNQWLWFWGNTYPSVYPLGTTAEIVFQASGVTSGLTPGVVVTYWQDGPAPPQYGAEQVPPTNYYYSAFSTSLIGPVAIPEPSAFVLLTIGAVALLLFRRRVQA